MNKHTPLNSFGDLTTDAGAFDMTDVIRRDAEKACGEIAPLWPLKDFVAVNPMLGHVTERFDTTVGRLLRTTGATLLLDGTSYADFIESGLVDDKQLRKAAAFLGLDAACDRDELVATLRQLDQKEPAVPSLLTVADVAGQIKGKDWTRFIVDQISGWAATYFDAGQSTWKNPWREEEPYLAWQHQATIDRTPDVMGLTGFCDLIATLPQDPLEALVFISESLALPAHSRGSYYLKLLSDIAGWAGYRRYQLWGSELKGEGPTGVIDMLAIRAAYDFALMKCLASQELAFQWQNAHQSLFIEAEADLGPKLLAQTAREITYQDFLLDRIGDRPELRDTEKGEKARPQAQAVFCIDVRSERIRRAIEETNPSVETHGFAGFFGFAIEVSREQSLSVQAQCPVLLEPGHRVNEQGLPEGQSSISTLPLSPFSSAWKRLKTGAISSFAFVESLGGVFLGALVRDSLRKPAIEKEPLGDLETIEGQCSGHKTGMTLEEKVATAKGALAGMSFNGRYARLAVLVGHGSTTTNNPYASGLDCGACGGHSGEANARVAAAVLNEQEVRERLAEEGVDVPRDTVFVAALHDTTTDEISFFDEDHIPTSHEEDLARLKQDFQRAARLTRFERADSLGIDAGAQIDLAIDHRSRDWSEVRPEWGLAGCAAFIAAPRDRTHGVDLCGRTFLHSYDWQADETNGVLELIMTAPLVVASWISLQYYGSSMDNKAYGSGDKTLHNVVGGLGILEGTAGDLRSGLPMQSVHTGKDLFHKPLRLTAVIEAPTARIDEVLTKHPNVRALFDNNWLHLIAITEDRATCLRYHPGGQWHDVSGPVAAGA